MVNRLSKKLWMLLPLVFLSCALMAWMVTPNAAGVGTHQSLGLPPCFFHQWTHLPCPSCGLTTSWSWLVHLEIKKAFTAHPFGPPLFLVSGIISLLAIQEALGKKTILQQILQGRHHFWIYLSILFFLIFWGIRLIDIVKN